MLWNHAGSITEIALGITFLIVAFNRRLRAYISKMNPYSVDWLVMLILMLIGLLEIYAGVSQLFRQR